MASLSEDAPEVDLDSLVEAVPWLLPIVLVLLSLKVIGTLGERIQRGLGRMRDEQERERFERERSTSSEGLQAGEKLPPIEPH